MDAAREGDVEKLKQELPEVGLSRARARVARGAR